METSSQEGQCKLEHSNFAQDDSNAIGFYLDGSPIGGLLPELWGDSMFSYTSVLLSGVGAFVGL
jgi:hypothetical protein